MSGGRRRRVYIALIVDSALARTGNERTRARAPKRLIVVFRHFTSNHGLLVTKALANRDLVVQKKNNKTNTTTTSKITHVAYLLEKVCT